MKRTMLVAISLLIAVVLGACVEDDVSFYIEKNNLPGTGCLPPSGDTSGSLAAGILDVHQQVKMGYVMFPTVVNNMNSSTTIDNQPERNNLHMKRIEVSIDMGGAGLSVDPGELDFSVPLSGMIPAQGSSSFGPLQVIDNSLATKFGAALCNDPTKRPVISIALRAVADRSSETRESAEFVFPVTLCCGCLVDWRPLKPASDSGDTFSNECGIPQDSRVTCYAAGGQAICMSGTGG